MRQLAIAFRSLMRQRGFFFGAVFAMALGIAAPTALFALIQGALLKPLPYANPDDIYAVRTAFSDGRFTSGLVATEELASARRSTRNHRRKGHRQLRVLADGGAAGLAVAAGSEVTQRVAPRKREMKTGSEF